MTPVINNQTATTIIPVVTSSNHNDRDSDYYKDLMNKYKILMNNMPKLSQTKLKHKNYISTTRNVMRGSEHY